jgi:predicted phage tail protein
LSNSPTRSSASRCCRHHLSWEQRSVGLSVERGRASGRIVGCASARERPLNHRCHTLWRLKGARTTAFQTTLRAHAAGCRWFWAWALLGCAAALGFVSLGILVLVPVAVVGGLMASKPAIVRSAFGLLTGVGVLLLCVAWVQRAGPGTTCWHTATASGCDEHLNPLPWLVAGIAMFIGGVVGHARRG